MTFDPMALPVVVWQEGSAIRAKRWDSSAATWRQLGGNIASVPSPYDPVVNAGSDGIVAVAYSYDVPIQLLGIYAKRYNYEW
jgi:hypothetical protein